MRERWSLKLRTRSSLHSPSKGSALVFLLLLAAGLLRNHRIVYLVICCKAEGQRLVVALWWAEAWAAQRPCGQVTRAQ